MAKILFATAILAESWQFVRVLVDKPSKSYYNMSTVLLTLRKLRVLLHSIHLFLHRNFPDKIPCVAYCKHS